MSEVWPRSHKKEEKSWISKLATCKLQKKAVENIFLYWYQISGSKHCLLKSKINPWSTWERTLIANGYYSVVNPSFTSWLLKLIFKIRCLIKHLELHKWVGLEWPMIVMGRVQAAPPLCKWRQWDVFSLWRNLHALFPSHTTVWRSTLREKAPEPFCYGFNGMKEDSRALYPLLSD